MHLAQVIIDTIKVHSAPPAQFLHQIRIQRFFEYLLYFLSERNKDKEENQNSWNYEKKISSGEYAGEINQTNASKNKQTQEIK